MTERRNLGGRRTSVCEGGVGGEEECPLFIGIEWMLTSQVSLTQEIARF